MSRVSVRVHERWIPSPPRPGEVLERRERRYQAKCLTGQCNWSSALHHVKAGAEEAARWHRDSHRVAAS